MAKNISKNSLKNKVIINIGTSTRRRKIKSKTKTESKNVVNQPPPNIIYNTVNPSVDPFGMRNQIQAQQLQSQNQLRVNSDLLQSLRNDIAIAQNNISEMKDVRNDPIRRALFLSPELIRQPRVDDTFVDLPPVDVELPSSTSASSSSSSTEMGDIQELPKLPIFVKTSTGSVKVINPITRREIDYGGQRYKDLVRAGVILPGYPPDGFFGNEE